MSSASLPLADAEKGKQPSLSNYPRSTSASGTKDDSRRSPQLIRPFSHHFFDPELANFRHAYLKIIIRAVVFIIILTWACLPIYFGSLSSSAHLTGNLDVWVINRDQARIGNSFVNTVKLTATSGLGALGWKIVAPDAIGSDEDVAQAIINEEAWGAIIIAPNATSRLTQARISGDTTYDPSSAITFYYAQARNEVATGTYLLPLATSFLQNFTTTYATGSVQRYLALVQDATTGDVNATAVHLLAQAPQTIAPGIAWKNVNLRVYDAPVAQAVTLVGQIYLCIFAFILVMAHSAARTLVEPYLSFAHYLALRIIVPLTLYLPLSFFYALVSLPFKLPFSAKYSYGGGFFLFWLFIYMGMCSLGLALEAMVTLLSPKFVPFFLVLLIIVNISTAALPPELQSPLYAYGVGFPFWNIEQAVRTLIFNTHSHLPENASILIAWSFISICTMSVFTFFVRRRQLRTALRARNLSPARSSSSRVGSTDALGKAEKGVSNEKVASAIASRAPSFKGERADSVKERRRYSGSDAGDEARMNTADVTVVPVLPATHTMESEPSTSSS